jgi:hypothetical protein
MGAKVAKSSCKDHKLIMNNKIVAVGKISSPECLILVIVRKAQKLNK